MVIPSIGKVEIIQHSAENDVAGKQFLPPSFETRVTKYEYIPEHQVNYLYQEAQSQTALHDFGRRLKEKIRSSEFEWKGIGVFKAAGNIITVSNENIHLPGWQPVPAVKVIRSGTVHQHLVGDRELSSTQVTDLLKGKKKFTSIEILVAAVILLLLIVFIVYQLVTGGFSPKSSGLQFDLLWTWLNYR